MPKVNYEKIRRTSAAQKKDEANAADTSLNIFLAGPFIELNAETVPQVKKKRTIILSQIRNLIQKATRSNDKFSEAQLLRLNLYKNLECLGHIIYLGEDQALRQNGKKNFGDKSNAVFYERQYIKEHTDAVIVLPSSPGSFCEIGDWASDKIICPTMLVIIDKKYKGEPSYINDGIALAAQHFRAKVVYEHYADTQLIFKICKAFIEEIMEDQRIEALYER